MLFHCILVVLVVVSDLFDGFEQVDGIVFDLVFGVTIRSILSWLLALLLRTLCIVHTSHHMPSQCLCSTSFSSSQNTLFPLCTH